MSHPWLLTLIPFLTFLGILFRFEMKSRKRDVVLRQRTEIYMRPLARTTERMFEKQYGRPSTDIENAFPEIRNAK